MARELFLAPPKQRIDPVIPQNKPVYRVLSEQGFFGPDHTLRKMGELIVLFDEPNEDMEPMNDLARAALEKTIEKLVESERAVAHQNGRHFAGRARTKEEVISAATDDARRVQSLSNPTGKAIMGARQDTSKRIQNVGDADVPDTGHKPAARARIETIGA